MLTAVKARCADAS